MIKYSDVAKIATRFVDADYALCDKAKGYDCLSMTLEFYRELGLDFPNEFNGFNEENYGEKWLTGEGLESYREFIEAVSDEIDPNYKIAGDLLIFDFGGRASINLGIYLGSGNAIMCFTKGIRVVPIKFFANRLKEARRCRNQQQ